MTSIQALSRLLTTCCILAVGISSLPFVLRKDLFPADVISSSKVMVLVAAKADILDTDAFCTYQYKIWWPTFRVKRRIALASWDPLWTAAFTDYVPPDLPVESIRGHPNTPSKEAKSQRKTYGCFCDCQDIRINVEVIISTKIDGKFHVRVRSRSSMPCPDGMVSEPYQKRSRRETSPTDETAFELLKLSSYSLGVHASQQDATGEEGPEVTGCRCVWPRKDKNGQPILPVYKSENQSQLELGKSYRYNENDKMRRRKTNKSDQTEAGSSSKRPRRDDSSLTPIDATDLAGEREEEAEEVLDTINWVVAEAVTQNDADFDDEETGLSSPRSPSRLHCYDFADPPVPSSISGEPQAPLDPVLAEDIDTYLRLTLSNFAGFENPDYEHRASSSSWFNFDESPGGSKG